MDTCTFKLITSVHPENEQYIPGDMIRHTVKQISKILFQS